MKKYMILGIVVLCIVSLILVWGLCTPGCGIQMWVTDVTTTGAKIVVNRIPDVGSVITGSDFFLERYTDKGWEPVPELPQEHDVAWTMEAYPIGPIPRSFQENWGWLYGTLPPGTYRLGKTFIKERRWTDNRYMTLYAQFKIDPV